MSRTDDVTADARIERLSELVERLADAVLAQNAAIGINTRSIDRLLLQLQAATNAMDVATNAQYEVRLAIKNVGERLAVIKEDVDDSEQAARDAERAAREVTGAFALSKREPEKHVAVGVIEAFGKQPRWSQSLIVVGIFATMLGLLLWKVLGG
jgi:hypothetical protein